MCFNSHDFIYTGNQIHQMKWTFWHTSVATVTSWWLASCIKFNLIVEMSASELGQGSHTQWIIVCLHRCTEGTHGSTRVHHGRKTTQWRRCDALGNVLLRNLADHLHPFVGAIFSVGWGLFQQEKAPTTKQQRLSNGLRRTTTRLRYWLGLQIPQDSIQTSEILSDLLRILWTAVTFPGRNDLDLCLQELSPIRVTQHRRITDDIGGCCTESARSKSVIWNVHLSPVSLYVRWDRLASSMSPLYPVSYPSLPVTATLIQGCLHTITVAASMPHMFIFNSLSFVSQREHDFLIVIIFRIVLCSFNEQQCIELTDGTSCPNTGSYR